MRQAVEMLERAEKLAQQQKKEDRLNYSLSLSS